MSQLWCLLFTLCMPPCHHNTIQSGVTKMGIVKWELHTTHSSYCTNCLFTAVMAYLLLWLPVLCTDSLLYCLPIYCSLCLLVLQWLCLQYWLSVCCNNCLFIALSNFFTALKACLLLWLPGYCTYNLLTALTVYLLINYLFTALNTYCPDCLFIVLTECLLHCLLFSSLPACFCTAWLFTVLPI